MLRRIYVTMTGALLLAVIVQFYLSAVGAFAAPQDDRSYALHELTGMFVIPGLSLLATVAAVVARAPRRLTALTILPLGLVIVQVLIVLGGSALDHGDDTTPAALTVLGLHAVNGLAIMAVAGILLRRAVAFARGSTDVTAVGTPSVGAAPGV